MSLAAGQIVDEILIQRAQAGSVPAAEALLQRWQDRLWHHARHLTGDEDAAWDILQEALIQIDRSMSTLRRPEAFGAWAYRITTGKARDWMRRRSREHDLMAAFAQETSRAPEQATPTAGTLSEALQHLSGPDRALLSLRYVEGYDTAETAAILEIPEGTVKSRLHSARARLKRILQEGEP